MRVLYLCLKDTFDTKMSRVRFDNIEAISKKVDVIYSGNGWNNYDSSKTVDENVKVIYRGEKPDIIVAYKPDNFKGFSSSLVPKCVQYNEMWAIKETTDEIVRNNVNLCIAHHLNDIGKYNHIKNVCFSHIPHSANEKVYKDYGEKKINDILFTGAIGVHYPFRTRLLSIIRNSLYKKVKTKILEHPGGNLKNIKGLIGEDYAREINRSKIVISCSSRYLYRLGKYVEIPMSGSILCGDLPDQDQDDFSKFMLVLNRNSSDSEIEKIILDQLGDKSDMDEKIKIGLDWSKNYTQEKYAERFIKSVEDFLKK